MKAIAITGCLIFLYQFSFGQSDVLFPKAVVELKSTEYVIQSLDKTRIYYKYRIKILKPQGVNHGNIRIPIDKNDRIVSFKGVILDSSGKQVKKIYRSDLSTVSDFDDYSLYSDNKVAKAEVYYFDFPYVVDYEYNMEIDGFMGCYWYMLDYYDIPTKSAKLAVQFPIEMNINWRTNNCTVICDTLEQGNTIKYSWNAENISPISDEDYTPGLGDLFPSILVTPTQFKYEGYSGKSDSWENFGKWIWTLLENRNSLPAETETRIHQLTDSISDTIAKMKKIYAYFGENTRYVSVQEGIGGVQPATASTVDQCKFGDCKALSNYLKALLAVIGVKAIYTVIGNGDDYKIKWGDFVGLSQTNHIIVCVPFQNDTIWLESTNNKMPFGYIGKGNSNRLALCITENGGKIVHTPRYDITDNFRHTTATIKLNEDGGMECKVHSMNSGVKMDGLIQLKNTDSKRQQKLMYENYPALDLEIKNYRISETAETFPKLMLDTEMDEHRFMAISGHRFTFKPNYLNRQGNNLCSSDKRENLVLIDYGFSISDSIRFILPGNFSLEYLPSPTEIHDAFGNYQSEYCFDGKELFYIRTFNLYEGLYPKEQYPGLLDFLNSIQTADNQNVIFKDN